MDGSPGGVKYRAPYGANKPCGDASENCENSENWRKVTHYLNTHKAD